MASVTITVHVRLRPWARAFLWVALRLMRVAVWMINIACDRGVEVKG